MMLANRFIRCSKSNCAKSLYKKSRNFSYCLSTIIGHYQTRLEINQSINKSVLIRNENNNTSNQLTHHVILTARPNEFEKLPPKCTACGIFLQTEYENSLGFIPEKKVFESIQNNESNDLVCYACFQLRHRNKPSIIPRPSNHEIFSQLKHLRQTKALVLYVIDVFDIEGSLLDNITSLISGKKRVIIVVNKVDRLPQDEAKPAKQLEKMKDVVKQICIDSGLSENNFRDICFVSARTGYGIHMLIQKMNKFRDNDMDVYLVGCANTGKSTLYNVIVNLLNVHKDENLPSQAIEHYTPGSTMSLLRQTISLRRLLKLDYRLKTGPWDEVKTFEFDGDFLKFMGVQEKDTHLYRNVPSLPDPNKLLDVQKLEVLHDNDRRRKQKKQNYIFDTPGVIKPQVIEYLEHDEIKSLYPSLWIVPRTVLMKPGECLFLGGLARFDFSKIWRPEMDNVHQEVDLAKSSQSIYVTVMASPNLPIHTSYIDGAEEKYESLFLNDILKIPKATAKRLDEFPPLQPLDYTIIGKNLNINASDIVVHGVGWFSVAAVTDARVQISLHTPNGIGQCFRRDPLLPHSVRKKSGRGVSYLGRTTHKMYGHTRKNSPSFVRVFQQQNDTTYAWKNKINEKLKFQRFENREEKRLKRLEQGTVLGKWRTLQAKEEEIAALLESNKVKSLDES